MKTMTATIDVDAPPEKVWDILTDLGRYRDWNPLFVEAAGDVAVGQRITLRSKHPANGRVMTVKPKIIAAKSGAELRWTSSLPGVAQFGSAAHWPHWPRSSLAPGGQVPRGCS
jgi:uncharacterized protein YndB with AHSA1/START domain